VFNLSGSEIIVILLLALVVLGPEKLPDAIRRAGRTYAELKKMGNSFQSEMRSVLDEPMQEMRETADLLRKSVDFTDGEMTTGTRSSTTSTPQPAPGASSTPAATPADDVTTPTGTDEAVDDAPATARESAAPAADPDEALINRTLSGGQ
jgi:sec-independent protein translocase protein TatB